MKLAAQFIAKFTNFITASLSCFDRVIFKGHLRLLSYSKGLEYFVDHTLGIRRKDFMAWAKGQSQRIIDHARHLAEQANCPFVYLNRPVRKDDLVQGFLRSQPVDQGLVCVLRCLEHCPSFRLTIGDRRPRFTPARPKCLVFYFYYLDPDLGLIHVRLPTLFPFAIQVAVNGHNYLARQMHRAGLQFVQQDNVFTELQDPARAQRLADHFERENWPRRLRQLARRVLPLMGDVLRPYAYYWVVDQAEYATDLIFTNRAALASLYPHLLDYAVLHFAAKDILTFLGRRLHPLFDGEILTECRKDRAPGARIKHRVGKNWLKMYDKLALVLRIETVINDPRLFRVRRRRQRKGQCKMVWCPMNKGVVNLYRYRQVALAANARYLDALSVVEPTRPVQAPLHRLAEPRRVRGRCFAGFNPARPKDLALFQAVLDGDHLLRGLRNVDLRVRLFGLDPSDPIQHRRRSNAVSRLLKRLHVHRILVKVPHTRRWHLTPPGRRLLTAAVEAYQRHFPQALDRLAA
ncbi:MAG: hypothetical protein WBF17_27370 [Phycisphaerae bacterium]